MRRPTPATQESEDQEAFTDAVVQTASDAGRAGRRPSTAEPGHPLVRLAGQIAQTDFAATYLAIGLGLDPAISPHVADLRDRTHR